MWYVCISDSHPKHENNKHIQLNCHKAFNYWHIVISDVNIEENTPTTWDCDISKLRYESYDYTKTEDI